MILNKEHGCKEPRLDIFGPYPPPMGGISVHIQRMGMFLDKENIHYLIYNHGCALGKNVIPTKKSVWWYFKYLLNGNADLVHFHQFFKFHFIYFFVFSFLTKRKLMITIHEENVLYYNGILKFVITQLLKLTQYSELIVVSKNLSDFLTRKRVSNILIPAYAPPLKIERKNPPLILNRYFAYSVWKANREIGSKIYNIDLAFKLLSKVSDRYHMLFLIGTEAESDKSYIKELIEKHAVFDSVTIIYESSLVEYLQNCHFLLRTNNVDGFGVSLQEALYLKIPAIASNVCVRPKGTILFQSGELEDLLDKVNHLDKYWDEASIESPNYHDELIELYKKHLA